MLEKSYWWPLPGREHLGHTRMGRRSREDTWYLTCRYSHEHGREASVWIHRLDHDEPGSLPRRFDSRQSLAVLARSGIACIDHNYWCEVDDNDGDTTLNTITVFTTSQWMLNIIGRYYSVIVLFTRTAFELMSIVSVMTNCALVALSASSQMMNDQFGFSTTVSVSLCVLIYRGCRGTIYSLFDLVAYDYITCILIVYSRKHLFELVPTFHTGQTNTRLSGTKCIKDTGWSTIMLTGRMQVSL